MSTPRGAYTSETLDKGFSDRQRKRAPAGSPVAFLAKVPLFSGLSRRHLRQLARLSQEVRFPAGRTIVGFGSRGSSFYAIVEGTARVTEGYSTRGRKKLGPGAFFGEMALLDGLPRSASVVADTPVVTIKIARTEFRNLLRREPDVALRLLEELSGRLREKGTSIHG
jgi:CRP/FNR family transcriptional regulator, cyclic AMP receptor protein